ncbi:MAG: hypothetical protein KatS3mg105_2655 [Gemmatales bacterium]|nr:MAG: hypothetical protein KatS3mg105_2655 [Gemmatales bacterium]
MSLKERACFGHCLFEIATHIRGLVESRFLWYVADLDAVRGTYRANEILVFQRHDSQQRTLAGAVATDYSDLRTKVEGKPDILQNFAFAVNLG